MEIVRAQFYYHKIQNDCKMWKIFWRLSWAIITTKVFIRPVARCYSDNDSGMGHGCLKEEGVVQFTSQLSSRVWFCSPPLYSKKNFLNHLPFISFGLEQKNVRIKRSGWWMNWSCSFFLSDTGSASILGFIRLEEKIVKSAADKIFPATIFISWHSRLIWEKVGGWIISWSCSG